MKKVLLIILFSAFIISVSFFVSQEEIAFADGPGCMDPAALNYDQNATEDDGSCTYDTTPPTLVSFTSITPNGSYGNGSTINITATFDEVLAPNSSMTVLLDNGVSVSLDSVSGDTLKGTFVTNSESLSSDLTVAEITSSSVADTRSNVQTNTSLPLSNIADTSDIVIVDESPASLVSFSTNTSNGSYGVGSTINITAHFDTTIAQGSYIAIVLDSGGTTTLSTVNGDKISGSYVVKTGDASSKLQVESVSFSDTNIVDQINSISGNTYTSYSNLTSRINIYSALNNTLNIQSRITGAGVLVGDQLYLGSAGPMYGVFVIDTKNKTFTKINTGLTYASRAFYVNGKVYLPANNFGGGVTTIDPLTNDFTRINTSRLYWSNTILVGNKLYIPNYSDGVDVLDVISNTFSRITTGGKYYYYSPTLVGNKLYIPRYGTLSNDQAIDVINIVDNTFSTILTPGYQYNSTPFLASNKLYFPLSNDNGGIAVVNTTNDTLLPKINTNRDYSVTPISVGNKVYLPAYSPGGIDIFNTLDETFTTIQTNKTFNLQYGALLGNNLYVGNFTPQLQIVDTRNDSVTNFNSNKISVSGVVGDDLYLTGGIANSSYGVNIFNVVDNSFKLSVLYPQLESFTTTATDGAYFSGQTIPIIANFNKNLGAGSTMTVVLNTGVTVTLNSINGSMLSGNYIVGADDTSPDLAVSSITSSSIVDTQGNSNTNYSIPSSINPFIGENSKISRNIGDSSNIVVGADFLKIPVGTNPYAVQSVNYNGTNYLYVSNQASSSVSVINTNTNSITSVIPVGGEPYGFTTATTTSGTFVYVANIASSTVSVINVASSSVVATVNVGFKPYYLATSNGKVFVTNSLSNTVSVIDANSNNVTATINVGTYPRGIKALGNKVYVANYGEPNYTIGANTVSVIDATNNAVLTTIRLPQGSTGPRGVAVGTSTVYVANYTSNNVSVIDAQSDTVTATINVGKGPRGLIVSGAYLYVENFDDGTISIINTNTNQVISTVVAGHSPAGIAVVGTDLYFSRFKDDVLSVLNTTTNTLRLVSAPDTTSPIISIVSTSTTQTTATITFTTNEAATSTLSYGTSTSYGLASSSSVLATSTTFNLTGLATSTLYHFMISAWDSSGNLATTTDYTLTTGSVVSVTAPTVTGQSATSISSATVTLNGTITSNNNASSTIRGFNYGLTTSYGSSTSTTGTYNTGTFSQSITNLIPNTLYHYQAFATNSAGTGTSSDVTFTTSALPDTTPPSLLSYTPSGSAVTNLSSQTELTMTFDENIAKGTGDIRIYKSDNTLVQTTDVTTSDVSISGSVATINLASSLDPVTSYYVEVDAGAFTDIAINPYAGISDSSTFTFSGILPSDTTSPIISSISSGTPTQTTATITWSTNESSDSQVDYGADDTYGSQTTLDATLVTSHSVTLSGLTAGSTYHFRVLSKDVSNNLATSTDNTFTTATATSSNNGGGGGSGRRSSGGGGGSVKKPATATSTPVTNPSLPLVPGINKLPQAKTTFTRSLTLGSSGLDVKQLQQFLNASGFPVALTGLGSAGNETTFFGAKTKIALGKFQRANGIFPFQGYFGPITRTYVNKLQ